MTKNAACPIDGLDGYILESYDTMTLCRAFDCEECVGDFDNLFEEADDGDDGIPWEYLEIPF